MTDTDKAEVKEELETEEGGQSVHWLTTMFMDRVNRVKAALENGEGRLLTLDQFRRYIQDGDDKTGIHFRLLVLKKVIYGVEHALPTSNVPEVLSITLPIGREYIEWERSWERRRRDLLKAKEHSAKKKAKEVLKRIQSPGKDAEEQTMVEVVEEVQVRQPLQRLTETERAIVTLLKAEMGRNGRKTFTVTYNGPTSPTDVNVVNSPVSDRV